MWYLLAIASLSVGCSTENEAPAKEKELPTNDETVVISLGSKFTEREEPLNDWTRAAGGNDLYGFQVWANEKGSEAIDNPQNNYTAIPICCGVFDNLNDIKIELSTKYTYNIALTYVPNGKNLVYLHSSGCYEGPFNMQNWMPTPLNKVIYTENDWMYSILNNAVNGSDNNNRHDGIYRLNVDHYYGQVFNIIPKADNIISINLKNMIWGLTLRAKKVEGKTYDKLLVKLAISGQHTRDFYINIDPNKEVSELVIPKILLSASCFHYYLISDYSESTRMTIGTDERPSEIISTEISIKQNVMKIIEFDATNEKVDNGVDVVIDDEDMKNETEIL